MGGTVTLLHQFSDAQFVPFIVFEIKIIFTIVGVFDYVKYGDISFLCRTQALLTLKKKNPLEGFNCTVAKGGKEAKQTNKQKAAPNRSALFLTHHQNSPLAKILHPSLFYRHQ